MFCSINVFLQPDTCGDIIDYVSDCDQSITSEKSI